MQQTHAKYSELAVNLSTSTFGISGFYLLILYVSFSITKNPLITGLTDSMSSFALVFSPIMASWVDARQFLGKISMYASSLRFLALVPIAISLYLQNNYLIIFSLFSAAFVVGLSSDLINSIRSVWIKENLKGEYIRKGTSLNQIIGTLADIIGYITVGFVLAFGQFISVLLILLAFALTTFTFVKFRKQEIKENLESYSILHGTIEGIKYVWIRPDLRNVFISYAFFNLVVGFLGVIFTVQTSFYNSTSSIYLGIILTILSIGIVVGSSISWFQKTNIVRIVAITAFGIGVSFFSLSLFSSLVMDSTLSFIVGASVGFFMVSAMTYIREKSSTDFTARTVGFITSFSQGSTFLAGALAGALIIVIGTSTTALLMGIATITVGGWFLLRFKKNPKIFN